MTALASHVIAAAILFNLDAAFRAFFYRLITFGITGRKPLLQIAENARMGLTATTKAKLSETITTLCYRHVASRKESFSTLYSDSIVTVGTSTPSQIRSMPIYKGVKLSIFVHWQ